jgi:hypothetical protein
MTGAFVAERWVVKEPNGMSRALREESAVPTTNTGASVGASTPLQDVRLSCHPCQQSPM